MLTQIFIYESLNGLVNVNSKQVRQNSHCKCIVACYIPGGKYTHKPTQWTKTRSLQSVWFKFFRYLLSTKCQYIGSKNRRPGAMVMAMTPRQVKAPPQECNFCNRKPLWFSDVAPLLSLRVCSQHNTMYSSYFLVLCYAWKILQHDIFHK